MAAPPVILQYRDCSTLTTISRRLMYLPPALPKAGQELVRLVGPGLEPNPVAISRLLVGSRSPPTLASTLPPSPGPPAAWAASPSLIVPRPASPNPSCGCSRDTPRIARRAATSASPTRTASTTRGELSDSRPPFPSHLPLARLLESPWNPHEFGVVTTAQRMPWQPWRCVEPSRPHRAPGFLQRPPSPLHLPKSTGRVSSPFGRRSRSCHLRRARFWNT